MKLTVNLDNRGVALLIKYSVNLKLYRFKRTARQLITLSRLNENPRTKSPIKDKASMGFSFEPLLTDRV